MAIIYLVLVLSLINPLESQFAPLFFYDPVLTNDHPISSKKTCNLNLDDRSANCEARNLKKVPDNLPPDILQLHLSSNRIPALKKDSFSSYTHLTVLALFDNQIKYIELRALHPLKRLTTLDLSFNPGLIINTGEIFRFSEQLSNIKLPYCKLGSIPPNFFQWLPSLTVLDLGDNQITFVNITFCGSTRMISKIQLDKNRLTNLSPNNFSLPCKVDFLGLTENRISTVDPDLIASIDVQKLWLSASHLENDMWKPFLTGVSRSEHIEELVLSNAHMERLNFTVLNLLHNKHLNVLDIGSEMKDLLYSQVFSGLNLVQHFILKSNRITEILPEYFTGMNSLRKLTLKGNDITSLNSYPKYTNWTIDLLELDVSYNLLREISQFTLIGLHNITILNLNSNEELSLLEISAFSGLPRLQYLNVSSTGLKQFSLYAPLLKSISYSGQRFLVHSPIRGGKTFKDAKALEYIDLSASMISLVNLYFNGSLFNGLAHLRILLLSNNDLSRWSDSLFQDTSALVELFLTNCKISHLRASMFTGLHSLETLHLRRNDIHQLPSDALEPLLQLTTLDISGNSLASIEEDAFSNSTSLTNLTLKENSLVVLNQSTFRRIESTLKSIDLSYNPIYCSCDQTWLVKLLKESIGLHVGDENHTICSSSAFESLKGKPLKMFDPDKLCQPNIILLCGIPILVVVTALMIVIVHHNRWWFRFKYFLLKLAVLGYQEIQDVRDHRDFDYDLNVMFVDDDMVWVRDLIKPFLEERLPDFDRVVFGDEGLILGMHILDAVDYVVQRSYKTVVLFSRRAVLDNWFLIKFRTAVDHVTDVQMENLVVIFLEDIPDAELPFLVRLYLSDRRPHLLWVEDEEGQEYFWKELLKDLSVNLRRNTLIPPE